MLSYFTDLQGSQTAVWALMSSMRLVTLLIYKVLKRDKFDVNMNLRLVTLLIYKVLKLSLGIPVYFEA